jgi:hypothetical protein
MGCWSVSCGISNIAITSGNKCCIIPLKENQGTGYHSHQIAALPIFGVYNDYGGLEHIEEDDNTRLIEEHLGITIEEFVTFLVDGKHTYNREEATEVQVKFEDREDYKVWKEVKDWNFMWVDRQVYDFMTHNYNDWEKGHFDMGTPEMLKLFGFEFIEETDNNPTHDPKRYRYHWRRGGLDVYSDKHYMQTGKGSGAIYRMNGGEYKDGLENLIDIPKELDYLRDMTSWEAWRLLGKSQVKQELGFVMGGRYEDDLMEAFREDFIEEGKELSIDFLRKYPKPPVLLHKKYMNDLEKFGDRLAGLVNVYRNLHPMSGEIRPYTLYLTPQCGEHAHHQILLEKFAEINKSYIRND